MRRWYATIDPQHTLPGCSDVLAFGTRSNEQSKPSTRRRRT